jgi:hypothetical protein
MNITLSNLESFQDATKQASRVLKCSTYSERLELADNMRKGVTVDFFKHKFDEDDDEEQDEEDNDETNSNIAEDNSKLFVFVWLIIKIMNYLASILSMPPIQNDQQFIQTMINQGRRKRKLEEDENFSNTKIRRITIKNEPEQVI